MIKNLIALALLASFLSAEATKEEKAKSSEYFNFQNSRSFFNNLELDFYKSTGDSGFLEHLRKATENEDWRLANYYFVYKLKKQVISVSGKKKSYGLQDYKTALDYFKKAVEKKNDVLSAYQGFRILEKYFFYVEKDNKVVQEFLPVFSKPLFEKGYCLGHLYYSRSFTKEYSSTYDYKKALEILKKGKISCQEGAHAFYKKGIKHEYAKTKTILRVSGENQ